MLSWNASKDEVRLAGLIASRATRLEGQDYEMRDAEMDILATHLNGCPLRLQELLDARDGDFAHDITGIRRFIDRNTGKLRGEFWPRFSCS